MTKKTFIIVFILMLLPFKKFSQLRVDKIETQKWYDIRVEKTSKNGRWVWLKKHYDHNKDTSLLINTLNNKLLKITNIKHGEFNGDNTFMFLKNDSLIELNLKTLNKKTINNILDFNYIHIQNCLIILDRDRKITISKGNEKIIIDNVITWNWNYDKTKLVLTKKESEYYHIILIKIQDKISSNKILTTIRKTSEWSWDVTGNFFAFFEFDELKANLIKVNVKENVCENLTQIINSTHQDLEVNISDTKKLTVMKNGKYILFPMTINKKGDCINERDFVSIIHSKKKQPLKSLNKNVSKNEIWCIWNDSLKKSIPIYDTHNGKMIPNFEQSIALWVDFNRYERNFHINEMADIYLIDFDTGNKKLLFENFRYNDSFIVWSPCNKNIAFYKDNDWHILNLLDNSNYSISKDINIDWSMNNYPGYEYMVWDRPVWLSDGSKILFTSEFDIWIFDLKSKFLKKLTNEFDPKRNFKLDKTSFLNYSNYKKLNFVDRTLDINQPMFFNYSISQNGSRGLILYHWDDSYQNFGDYNSYINHLVNANNEIIFYQIESSDQPPKLMMYDLKSKKNKLIYKSNAENKNIELGKSKVLTFYNDNNEIGYAALHLPPNYDENKQYPTIINIYESFSRKTNEFVRPTLFNPTGFNKSVFTQLGYIVVQPDIKYDFSNPGISALTTIKGLVKTLIERRISHPEKIGLIGHSFGGYETNFILTQTPLFKAAVSGSSISDIQQGYFEYNNRSYESEYWRYESQQFRMKGSFFEKQNDYYKNNPMNFISNINTPLLIFTGDKDNTVNPSHSYKLLNALHRADKTSILLSYSNQSHVFYDQIMMKDLSIKIIDWFEYYLNNKEFKGWMCY